MRERYKMVVGLYFFVGFCMGILAFEVSIYFLVLLAVLLVVSVWYVRTVKCRSCGDPVIYNHLMSLSPRDWSPWIPDNCTKCGERID